MRIRVKSCLLYTSVFIEADDEFSEKQKFSNSGTACRFYFRTDSHSGSTVSYTHLEQTYEEPVYEEPSYEEPVYEEPSYEEPSYEEPSYDEGGSGEAVGGGDGCLDGGLVW